MPGNYVAGANIAATLFGRSRRLSAAKIRARAKRAALAASRPDAKLHPVQAHKCTPHTLEAILAPGTVRRRPI